MPQIKCTDLTLGYGSQEILSGLSFEVSAGDYLCIVGENGSGKTTALNIISASLPADSGKVILANDDISSLPEYKRARRIKFYCSKLF